MSNILLADDNPHAQRMGSQILSQEGHDVVTVSDGDEAMQYLGENRPDLVMVDTRMPGPSGFEICKHVKSSPTLGTIKVVLLAGPLEPFDTAEAEDAGPDGVLHKPLDAYTLIETVNSLLGMVEEVRGADETSRESEPEPSAEGAMEEAVGEAFGPEDEEQETSAPQAAASDNGAPPELADDLSDQFASVVEQALGTGVAEAQKKERIHAAIRAVLEANTPAIIDQIAEKVMQSLDND